MCVFVCGVGVCMCVCVCVRVYVCVYLMYLYMHMLCNTLTPQIKGMPKPIIIISHIP